MKPKNVLSLNRSVFLLSVGLCLSNFVVSQSVNLNTGTAHASIPVYAVSRGAVSVPISLEYEATGIRPGDLETVLGTQWQLNAGGVITRTLRDLPDDIKSDQVGNSRMGWLYNQNATKINSFTVANDNNPSTCTDETTDINYINTNFSDTSDMEPDIFDVQAPGLSTRLVYDRINSVFRTIPYQDLQISYILNGASNSLISFKIVNDKGIEYTFDVIEPVTQSASSSNPGGISYFKRNYLLYRAGIIYNSKWYLSKIKDLNGNVISLSYSLASLKSLTIPTAVITGAAGNTSTRTLFYNTVQTYYPNLLLSIYLYNSSTLVDYASFAYGYGVDGSNWIVNNISLANGRTFFFTYNHVPSRTRDYLTYFGEPGCVSGGSTYNAIQYKFDYSGIDFTSSSRNVPDPNTISNYQDYWGYTNGDVTTTPLLYVYPDNSSYPNLERYRISPIPGYSGTYYTLNGSDKTTDPYQIDVGTLTKITYPTGGNTAYTYESNDYFDNSASTTYQGGGLRIKQIVIYDGISTSNNITRNYSYADPSTSITTGKPISVPIIAFTIPYTGTATGLDYWNYSTVRLETNFSGEYQTILYGKITVQQTGAGKTIYEYTNPATFWDASGGIDWTPTVVNTGRIGSGSCPAIGSLKNAKYTYPFVPNINYDFERGILTKGTIYNEIGNLVSQTTYSYQRSFTNPIQITALKFDDNSATKSYAKYQIFSSTSELLSSETKFINDLSNTSNDPTKRVQTTSNYYYQSANHKLPTKVETINTDGSTNKTYLKYTKDYTIPSDGGVDAPSIALQGLINLKVNIPAEKYYTVTRASTEKTFGAELIQFGSFPSGTTPPTIYLPAQKLKFLSPVGVTDFTSSTVNLSSGAFSNYNGYITAANYQSYNYSGSLLTADDNYHNVKTQLIDDDILLPIASVTNAKYNEMAYSNFDGSDYKYGFSQTGSSYISTISRSGAKCLSFPTAGLLQAPISLQPNAKNYIFSCWVNSSATGALTVSLYTSGNSLFGTKTINFISSGSGWIYYEQKISTNGLTSSFTIKVQTNAAINIDDIVFYPENAEVNTFAYDRKFFAKTCGTSTNGVSNYYSLDSYGRPQFVFDQDKNIILKKTYEGPNGIASGLISASFSANPVSPAMVGTSVLFTGNSGSGACTPGTYYSWNFGDGSTTTPSLTATASHTYGTSNTYTVTLTVTNSIYGTKTFSQSFVVSFLSLGVTICQSGVQTYYRSPPHVTTVDCSPNPNNSTHSYYTVTSITGASSDDGFSYQWQINYTDGGTGSGVWTNTGTNYYQLVINVNSSSRPYKVRCNVTDLTTSQTGTSNEISFYVQ